MGTATHPTAMRTPETQCRRGRGAGASTPRYARGSAPTGRGDVTAPCPGLHSPSWGDRSPGAGAAVPADWDRGGGLSVTHVYTCFSNEGLGLRGAPATSTVPPLLLLCPAPLFPSRFLGEWLRPKRTHLS